MSAIGRPIVTEAEYLAWDLAHEGKHEFVNFEIVAMAGASEGHGIVVANAALALGVRLRGGPCRLFIADLRVRIDETGLYAYPDVVVVCGERRFAPTTPESLLNPSVIIEVLSPTTATYDRGAKVAHYRRRPTVSDIVLLDPDARTVEHYARLGDEEWRLATLRDGELGLVALGLAIPVAELFEGL